MFLTSRMSYIQTVFRIGQKSTNTGAVFCCHTQGATLCEAGFAEMIPLKGEKG